MRPALEVLETRALLSALTVTTTANGGAGSLRRAINDANSAGSGPVTIQFQIPTSDPNFVDDDSGLPGGDPGPDVFVIQPTSALPALNNPNATIVIDGRTQASFTGDTNPFGPEIVLDGTSAGSANGLLIQSSGNEVHGLDIRRFSADGVVITSGSNNWVAGNYLGTDATGTLAAGNTGFGAHLSGSATSNIIGTNGDGTDDANEGNLISTNGGGVGIQGTAVIGNVLAGNLIGTDRTGTTTLGVQGDNVWLVQGASNNRIGTNLDGVSDNFERNVIDGGHFSGITVYNDHTDNNVIAGNYIGVDVTGTKALGNGVGIPFGYMYGGVGAANTQIIGNVISGNGTGVGIDDASHGTLITGNLIGTNAAGTGALANVYGLSIGGFGNTVGGTTTSARNVISGNSNTGVFFTDSTAVRNVVLGNFIGTDVNGTTAVANGNGVVIQSGASSNLIGGSDSSDRNVISGNGASGVLITGAGTTQNMVAANYIGTDKTGNLAVGNRSRGVQIAAGANHNFVGTNGDSSADAAEGNVISGNMSVGIFITGTGTTDNAVAGNFIGTNAAGIAPLSNGGASGVRITNGAQRNRIGTSGDGVSDGAERNLISGNVGNGVQIDGSGTTQNVVAGNFIGTNAVGNAAVGNGDTGVKLASGAQSNVIGTNGDGTGDSVEGNVISGNANLGVDITDPGTNYNVVAGNLIGTDKTGTAAVPNATPTTGLGGALIDNLAAFNLIGTNGDGASDDLERNVISGNQRFMGLMIQNATDNVVAGNYIGTASDGTTRLPNAGNGMDVKAGAQRNRIGTNADGVGDAAERNVISGNVGTGIIIWNNSQPGTGHNVVAGNFIGTDKTGSAALGNSGAGIVIFDGAQSNTVGGTSGASRNVISNNGISGVYVKDAGTTSNVIAGNFIGTDLTGTVAMGNQNDAITIDRAPGNTVGGTASGAGNVLAAAAYSGVYIYGSDATGNVVQGNLIGTIASGSAAIGNNQDGVTIDNAPGNMVGGTTSFAGNLISGNAHYGVYVFGIGATGNTVQGNLIGTAGDGSTALGNGKDGVAISSARNNVIGGADSGAGNVISGNAVNGVSIAAGSELYGAGLPISFTDGVNPGLLGFGSVSSEADLSAEMFTGYSDTSLFVAFRVRDDFIDADTNDPEQPFLNDSVELYIDGDRVANDYTSFGPGSREGFQLVSDTMGNKETIGQGMNDADWSVATSRFPGGYIIEFALPLALIDTHDGAGMTPAGPGSLLRFNAAITDNDRNGNVQDTYGILWRQGSTFPAGNGESVWVTDLYLENGTPPNSAAPVLITAPHRSTGMLLDGSIGNGASGNIVQGNVIGTSRDGSGSLGNGGDGVRISDNAQNNQVGGVGNGEANSIAFNSGNGVTVVGDLSTGNMIRGNTVRDNNGLGIDLGDDGVTPNHALGPIAGPNGLTNFPMIIAARPGPSTHIVGSYSGAPDTLVTIDLYASSAPDPSGYGEGQRFLGFVVVVTDDAGNANFTVDLDASSPGEFITGTATDDANNTSEFSAAAEVDDVPPTVADISDVTPDPRNTAVDSVDVVFSEAIDSTTFGAGNLALSLNGTSITISVPLTFTPVSPTTVRVTGLAPLTGSQGTYIVTASAAGVQDKAGNVGSSSSSAQDSWLMDTTAPNSHVNSLAPRQTSKIFTVSVTGSDPSPGAGITPSGVAAYDIDVAVDGTSFSYWTTVPATAASAVYTGQSNHTYAFHSVARDLAGNVESKGATVIEASTFLPDLDPPDTRVSSVDSSTSTFVVTTTGTDSGGSGLRFFDVFVQVDGGSAQQIGRLSAGSPDLGGHYTRSLDYQANSDGLSHSYRFYSTGEDGNGNIEAAPTDPNADIVVTAVFATPPDLAVTAFDVQQGATERSFIRYLDLTFNLSTSQTSALSQIVASVNDSDPSNDRIKLIRHGLDGSGGTQVSLANLLQAVDHVIEINFGGNGIGGNPNSTAGDGYYDLDLDLEGDGSFETVRHFYRLLGDANGDHVVDSNDLSMITAAFGQSGPELEADVNGDGVVNALDRTLAARSLGRRLASGLPLDD